MNQIIITECKNPYHNLALEEYLMENSTVPTLYLWQNANTVVIGYAQNAYAECRLEKIKEDGGYLARRTTGGGAVYHDLGNLNFTFVMPNAVYDQLKQFEVIKDAVKVFGLNAELSGRNDVLIEGKKFSGNAFKHTKNNSIHHGTLMVDVNTDILASYLTVSKAKIEAKGIKSVRSRVINLKDLNPEITISSLTAALKEAFIKHYGECEISENENINNPVLNALTEKFASDEWRLGNNPTCNVNFGGRFDFGGIDFHLNVAKGRIENCVIYSDMLDADFIRALSENLKGIYYTGSAVFEVLDKTPAKIPEQKTEIKELIAANMI